MEQFYGLDKEKKKTGQPGGPQPLQKTVSNIMSPLKGVVGGRPSQQAAPQAAPERTSPQGSFAERSMAAARGGETPQSLPTSSSIEPDKNIGEQALGLAGDVLGSPFRAAWAGGGQLLQGASQTVGGLAQMAWNTPGAFVSEDARDEWMQGGINVVQGAGRVKGAPFIGIMQEVPGIREASQFTDAAMESAKVGMIDGIQATMGVKFSDQKKQALKMQLDSIEGTANSIMALGGIPLLKRMGGKTGAIAKVVDIADNITDFPVRMSMKAMNNITGGAFKAASSAAGARMGTKSVKATDVIRDLAGGNFELRDNSMMAKVDGMVQNSPTLQNAFNYLGKMASSGKNATDAVASKIEEQGTRMFERLFPIDQAKQEEAKGFAEQAKKNFAYEQVFRDGYENIEQSFSKLYTDITKEIETGDSPIPRSPKIVYDTIVDEVVNTLPKQQAFLDETTSFLQDNIGLIVEKRTPKPIRQLFTDMRTRIVEDGSLGYLKEIKDQLDQMIPQDATGSKGYLMALRGAITKDIETTARSMDAGIDQAFLRLEQEEGSITSSQYETLASEFATALDTGGKALTRFLDTYAGKFDEVTLKRLKDTISSQAEVMLTAQPEKGQYILNKLLDENAKELSPSRPVAGEGIWSRSMEVLGTLRTGVKYETMGVLDPQVNERIVMQEAAIKGGNQVAINRLNAMVGADSKDIFGLLNTNSRQTSALVAEMVGKFDALKDQGRLPKDLNLLPHTTVGKYMGKITSAFVDRHKRIGAEIQAELTKRQDNPLSFADEKGNPIKIHETIADIIAKDFDVKIKDGQITSLSGSSLRGVSKTIPEALNSVLRELKGLDRRATTTKGEHALTVKRLQTAIDVVDNFLSSAKFSESLDIESKSLKKLEGLRTKILTEMNKPIKDNVELATLAELNREFFDSSEVLRKAGALWFGKKNAADIKRVSDTGYNWSKLQDMKNNELFISGANLISKYRTSSLSKMIGSFDIMAQVLHMDPTAVKQGGKGDGEKIVENPEILRDLGEILSVAEEIYSFKLKDNAFGQNDPLFAENNGAAGISAVFEPITEQLLKVVKPNKQTTARAIFTQYAQGRHNFLEEIRERRKSGGFVQQAPESVPTGDTYVKDTPGMDWDMEGEEEQTL